MNKKNPFSTLDKSFQSLWGDLNKLADTDFKSDTIDDETIQLTESKITKSFENIQVQLVSQSINASLIGLVFFQYWFMLDAPFQGYEWSSSDEFYGINSMTPIITLLKQKMIQLPDVENKATDSVDEDEGLLTEAAISLLADPSQLTKKEMANQWVIVNEAMHSLTSSLLKDNIPVEILVKALFKQWLQQTIFFDVSIEERRKMLYNLDETLYTARQYFRKSTH